MTPMAMGVAIRSIAVREETTPSIPISTEAPISVMHAPSMREAIATVTVFVIPWTFVPVETMESIAISMAPQISAIAAL